VVPLDQEGYWYRYHHLFRDFLQTRLKKIQPDRIPSLHRIASNWYAAEGLLSEAVQHALQSQDWDFAASVVEKYGMQTLMHSEISTVYEWCSAFPEEALQAHPMLCILQGWTLVLGYRAQNRQKVEARLQQAEQAADAMADKGQGRWLAGQSAAVRAFLGAIPDPRADPEKELNLAERALDLLPEGDPLRSTTTLTVGYAHLAAHDTAAGYAALEEAKRLSLAGRNYYGVVDAAFNQAMLAYNQGKLRRSSEICHQAQADISALLGDPVHELPAVGCLDIVLGCIAFEQDRLDEAEQLLDRGQNLIGWTFNPYYRLTACLALFRLREIQSRSTEALAFLAQLQEAWPDITFFTEALRMAHALRIAPEDPQTISKLTSWTKAFSSSLGKELPVSGVGPLGAAEPYYLSCLAWARAQIAIGQSKAALQYLERQLEISTTHGLDRRRIALSIAAALAWQELGNKKKVEEALECAVELAEPEGFVRLFDDGPAVIRLLNQTAERGVAREYISHMMQAISPPAPPAVVRLPEGLAEALSERELEILRLMAHGASNQEIADQLVIAVGTVKSHISHILGKLNADNRTKAVARARELGLLEI
jgi:LuxR family maltose regulon positive regulatory protein